MVTSLKNEKNALTKLVRREILFFFLPVFKSSFQFWTFFLSIFENLFDFWEKKVIFINLRFLSYSGEIIYIRPKDLKTNKVCFF